ncbi:hypothetical protein FQN49_001368 [Arthroderma sp. PD_2]|nr:hypothetical protein FQN49_001368 [Arthroderma sp. PD_2]
MRFIPTLLALVAAGPMMTTAAPTRAADLGAGTSGVVGPQSDSIDNVLPPARRDTMKLHAGTSEVVGPQPDTMKVRRDTMTLHAGTSEVVGPQPDTMKVRRDTMKLHAGTSEVVGPQPDTNMA